VLTSAKGKGELPKPKEHLAEFRADGTVVLSSPRQARTGRYACANGMLWIVLEGPPAAASLRWAGKDRFTLQLGGSELAFARQKIAPKLPTPSEEVDETGDSSDAD